MVVPQEEEEILIDFVSFTSRLYVTLKGNEKPFGYGLLAWIAYMRHIYECNSVKEKETFEYDS